MTLQSLHTVTSLHAITATIRPKTLAASHIDANVSSYGMVEEYPTLLRKSARAFHILLSSYFIDVHAHWEWFTRYWYCTMFMYTWAPLRMSQFRAIMTSCCSTHDRKTRFGTVLKVHLKRNGAYLPSGGIKQKTIASVSSMESLRDQDKSCLTSANSLDDALLGLFYCNWWNSCKCQFCM